MIVHIHSSKLLLFIIITIMVSELFSTTQLNANDRLK